MARIRGTNGTQPGPFRSLAVAAALAVATVTGSAVARQAGPRQWRALGEEARNAETMDASLRRLAAEKGVTALSVAVVDGGRTVYARPVGAPQSGHSRFSRTVSCSIAIGSWLAWR